MDKGAEITSRAVIYGGNFLAGAIGKAFDYDLANPYAAIAYATLDTLGVSERVRESPLTGIANLGGALFFGVSTVTDLVRILNKDYSAIADLPFDASMALQIGTNAITGSGLANLEKVMGKEPVEIKDRVNY